MNSNSSAIGRSSNFLTLTLRVTLDDGTTVERQTTPFAVLAMRAAASDTVETLGTADLSTLAEGHPEREKEKAILHEIAQNFPVENAASYYWLLGSGYHDGEQGCHSADINSLSGGDTDRGAPIRAVADGVLRIGAYTGDLQKDLNVGAVTISHTQANGQDVPWTSAYLHMPIVTTGLRELVAVRVDGVDRMEDREIFEVLEQHTVNNAIVATGRAIRIWNDMVVQAQDQIGYLGGREGRNDDGTYADGLGNAHLHFQAFLGNRGIDLRKAIAAAGITTVKASDGGVDTSWFTIQDNKTLAVEWEPTAGAWVSFGDRVLLDRSPQEAASPGTGNAQAWLAWQDGVPLEQMQRVVWKAVKYEGEALPQERWVMASDDTQEWDAQERRFVDRKKA